MVVREKNNSWLIKIYKNELNDFDIYDKEQVLELFKSIFMKIKDKYKLFGLLEADIYVNDDYGMIIQIDSICFFRGEIDIKVNIHLDKIFLMEISSYDILDYDEVFCYKDKFYGKFKAFGDSNVIYKNVDEIINKGIKIY